MVIVRPDIVVLRLGHRPGRDKRVTTHVGLVARAFGADKIIISTKDRELENTLKKVNTRFGNHFEIETGVSWKKFLDTWDGVIAHLTMYGEPLNLVLAEIPKDKPLLIVVGAEKVPSELYTLSDFNVAIGNQPHSEVAALAVFLDRFLGDESLQKDFQGQLKVIPSKRGKVVVKR